MSKFLSSLFEKREIVAESLQIGIFLAIVGGFLDAYTFISRGGVFANAQTGNIVLFGIEVANGSWAKAMSYLPPIIAFIAGVLLTEFIRNTYNSSKVNYEKIILILEAVILFIVGFFSIKASDNLVTIAIAFVSSIQITSFKKLVDSPYSTTMTTGNLRIGTEALYNALFKKDKIAAKRAARYYIIILTFILGGIIGSYFTIVIGVRSVWICCIVLLITIKLLSKS